LLRTLVDQFTGAIKDIRGDSATPARGSRVDLKPPRFDGNSDVHLFLRQFAEVTQLNGWSNRVALAQLRNSLDKGARDCGQGDTLSEVFSQLLAMYGLTPPEARERLHQLRQDPSESYLQLGGRVGKLTRLAYGGLGGGIEVQMALEHFDRAVTDPALRQHLLVVQPQTLKDAVAAAERYALVGSQPVRPSRGRDAARVAPVQGTPGTEGEADQKAGDEMSELMKFLTVQFEAQAVRLSALEKQGKGDGATWKASKVAGRKKTNDGCCFKCGDSSHFIRDCPSWKFDSQMPNSKPFNSQGSGNF
jgi:hypothetical protein